MGTGEEILEGLRVDTGETTILSLARLEISHNRFRCGRECERSQGTAHTTAQGLALARSAFKVAWPVCYATGLECCDEGPRSSRGLSPLP